MTLRIRVVKWIIARWLPDYHLHLNPVNTSKYVRITATTATVNVNGEEQA